MNISPLNNTNQPSFKAIHYIDISKGKYLNKLDIAESAYLATIAGQITGKNTTLAKKAHNLFKSLGNLPTDFWNSPGEKYLNEIKKDKRIHSLSWLEGHLHFKFGVNLESVKGLFIKEGEAHTLGLITGKENKKIKGLQKKIETKAAEWTDKILQDMERQGKKLDAGDESMLKNLGLYLKTNEALLSLENSRNVHRVTVNRMSELPGALKSIKSFEQKRAL